MEGAMLLYVLFQGFAIGAGPCLLICAPLIVPYIAGTRRTWEDGLRATLVFSLSRLAVYSILGALSGLVGAYVIGLFVGTPFSFYVWTVGALFIIVLGILIIFGGRVNWGFCRMLDRCAVKDPTWSMILLGIMVGLSPCLPLLAILVQIAILSEKFYIGALYGFTFGIGTVLSPLLLLGALAPVLPARLLKTEKANIVFNAICGGLLVLVGVYVLVSRL